MMRLTSDYFFWDGRSFVFGGKDILHDTEECIKVIEEVIFDNMIEKTEEISYEN